MPEYGLIGDSSLYCKSSKKRVKRIGCQLQEELATNDLWYHAVANAGVEKILQMIADTRLKFGTLGISYFGNDIMYGKIRPQVRCSVYHAQVIDRLQTCVEGGIEFEKATFQHRDSYGFIQHVTRLELPGKTSSTWWRRRPTAWCLWWGEAPSAFGRKQIVGKLKVLCGFAYDWVTLWCWMWF